MASSDFGEAEELSRRKFLLAATGFLALSSVGGLVAGNTIKEAKMTDLDDSVRATAMALEDPTVRSQELENTPDIVKNNSFRLKMLSSVDTEEDMINLAWGSCIGVEQDTFVTARHVAQTLVSPRFQYLTLDQPHKRSNDIVVLPREISVAFPRDPELDLAVVKLNSPSALSALRQLPVTSAIDKFPIDCVFLGFAFSASAGAGFHVARFDLSDSWVPDFIDHQYVAEQDSTGGDSGAGVVHEGKLVGLLVGSNTFRAKVEPITDSLYQEMKNRLQPLVG